jgi:hypothetical protein
LRPTVYFYDGDHGAEPQTKGVLHFREIYSYPLVLLVDDWNWDMPHDGTLAGIRQLGAPILYQHEVKTVVQGANFDSDGWWNGFVCFLLGAP